MCGVDYDGERLPCLHVFMCVSVCVCVKVTVQSLHMCMCVYVCVSCCGNLSANGDNVGLKEEGKQ